MTDDDEPLGHDPLARAYDYFKHMTTLSLVTIGGVLGLLKGDGPTLKPLAVGLIIGTIAAGGVVAMAALSALAQVGLRGGAEHVAKVRKMLPWMQGAATFLVMLGLGMFLGNFVAELGG